MATVKVRIAVAVDPKGNWCCAGWAGGSDEALMDCAIDGVDPGDAHYFLTAELSIPETRDIAADVESVPGMPQDAATPQINQQ